MIATARLVLEPVREDHAALMFEGLRDERAYRFLDDGPPAAVATLAARYRMLAGARSPDGAEIWLNWMLRHGDVYAGYIQATVILNERAALVAYHVFPAFWRRGLAREAVGAMLKILACDHDAREARAYIDTENVASIGLVESLGFRLADTIAGDDYLYTKSLA